jgi:5-oxoprolinase (ATP-hydrolysing) subunit B
MTDVRVDRFGERALLVRVDDQARIHAIAATMTADLTAGRSADPMDRGAARGVDHAARWLVDVVPGDRSLLIVFDGTDAGETAARNALAAAVRDPVPHAHPARHHVIPVRYGGASGPDLPEAAHLAGMTPARLVELHAGRDLPVQFLGFAPGFAYIGELPGELAVPRLAVPRTTTRAGSVAIAERYSAIYPADLPGGWRVIGWTATPMFDPTADPPTTLLPGDTVRFEPVGGSEVSP